MSHRFIINRDVNDIVGDIRETRDPIRKIILKKFLTIKMNQLRSEAEDPSLDDLSLDDMSSDGVSNSSEIEDADQSNGVNKTTRSKEMSTAQRELESIMKSQKDSLNELDKQAKMKAYSEIISDNRRDQDQRDIVKKRG